MTEASAALIGSVATAALGLIGVLIAQIVSWKTAKLRSKEEKVAPVKQVTQGELPFEALPGSGLTGFAMIRLDLEGLKLLMLRSHEENLKCMQTLSAQIHDLRVSPCQVIEGRVDQKESS